MNARNEIDNEPVAKLARIQIEIACVDSHLGPSVRTLTVYTDPLCGRYRVHSVQHSDQIRSDCGRTRLKVLAGLYPARRTAPPSAASGHATKIMARNHHSRSNRLSGWREANPPAAAPEQAGMVWSLATDWIVILKFLHLLLPQTNRRQIRTNSNKEGYL